MLRSAACCVLGMAALLTGLTATAADASSGVITVISASSPASSVGSLSVELESTTPVDQSSITAQLSTGGTNVLTVSDFILTAGVNNGGTVTTWTVATPITVAQLPLGTYTIGVSASDAGGDTVSVPDAGTLAYLVQPTLTLTASPTNPSYGQTVTFSGTVTGLFPDGSEQPVKDQTVYVDVGDGIATTDNYGNFSVSVSAGPANFFGGGIFYAKITDSATVANGYSSYVTITPTPDPTRFTTQLSSDAVTYGTPVTWSGQIMFESGTTWLPLTGASIFIANSYVGYPDPIYGFSDSVVSDTKGAFTDPLPVTGPELFQAEYSPPVYYNAWFSQPATVDLPLSVVLPDGLSPVKVNLTPVGRVGLTTCLDITAPAAGAEYVNPMKVIPDRPYALFQYATSPSGPWKTLISAAPTFGGAKSTPTAQCYSGAATAPGTSDYYRAATAGTVNFQPATSSVVKASVDPSRFASLTAAPTRPKASQRVTVAGQLQQLTSGWHALAHQKVDVIFRAKGSKTWTVLAVVTTGASGGFSAKVRIHRNGLLSARYLGSKTDLRCSARHIRIDIRK